MKTTHRLRALLLKRQADALLRKASRYQTASQRSSKQPAAMQVDGWVATWSAMLALSALIVCNFSPEPVSCDRPAQVVQK